MIAIYTRPGSFSDRWIEICRSSKIPFLPVDIFDGDLINTLRKNSVTVLLSHPPMASRAGALASKAIIRALTCAGIKVFPCDADYWHFDDKLAQSCAFEALGIPTPRTHVFYEKRRAREWIDTAVFPWVFKLKSGAGSTNVSLLKNKKQAIERAERMFGSGMPSNDNTIKDFGTKFRTHKAKRDWVAVAKRAPRTIATWWKLRKEIDTERGYFYIQEFIDGNHHDTRITVIGNRAFAFRRKVRSGDFRASGSGFIDHDPNGIDIQCVSTAFESARALGSYSMAFDFVGSERDSRQLIVEMSFGFKSEPVFDCPGHWTSDLTWCEGRRRPEDIIFEDMTKGVKLDAEL